MSNIARASDLSDFRVILLSPRLYAGGGPYAFGQHRFQHQEHLCHWNSDVNENLLQELAFFSPFTIFAKYCKKGFRGQALLNGRQSNDIGMLLALRLYNQKLKRCGMRWWCWFKFKKQTVSNLRFGSFRSTICLLLLEQNKTESPTHNLGLCSHYGIEMRSDVLRNIASKPRPRNTRNARMKDLGQELTQIMQNTLKSTWRQTHMVRYDKPRAARIFSTRSEMVLLYSLKPMMKR